MKITEQKNGRWNEEDRLELAKILLKAGYTVRIGKEKPPGKSTNVIYVEYLEDED